MNDSTKFDQYAVDSWFDQQCLWLRIEGAARDLVNLVKHSVAPVAAAVVMGASIFGAPADVLASTPTSVSSISEPVVSMEVGRPIYQSLKTVEVSTLQAQALQSHDVLLATKVTPAQLEASDWATKEVARLRGNIRSAIARMQANDSSHFAESSVALAKLAAEKLASDASEVHLKTRAS